MLLSIGEWLKVNGESIYDTTHWKIFGEGPTRVEEGAFTDVKRSAFTSSDIRFTYKTPFLYAIVLKWPEDGNVTITSLKDSVRLFLGHVERVELLGFYNVVSASREADGLRLTVAGKIDSDYPVVFKLKVE